MMINRVGTREKICSFETLNKSVEILLEFENKSAMALEFLCYIAFIFEEYTIYTERNMTELVQIYHKKTNKTQQISYKENKQAHFDCLEIHEFAYLRELQIEMSKHDKNLSHRNQLYLALIINELIISKNDYKHLTKYNKDVENQTIVWSNVFSSLKIFTQDIFTEDDMKIAFNSK